jgi:hypothetical protein
MSGSQSKRLRITMYVRARKQDGALHCVGPNRTVKDVLKELRKLTGLEALESLWTRDGFRLWNRAEIWPLVDHDSVLVACDRNAFPAAAAAAVAAIVAAPRPVAVAAAARRKRAVTPPSLAQNQHVMAAATCFLAMISDEAALLIALALPTAIDKLRLALVCRRYGSRSAAAAADGWSVAEESARQWLLDECSAQERGWAPREGGASWLGLMWQVQRLRRPLTFTSLGTGYCVGDGVALSEEGALLLLPSACCRDEGSPSHALSLAVHSMC